MGYIMMVAITEFLVGKRHTGTFKAYFAQRETRLVMEYCLFK